MTSKRPPKLPLHLQVVDPDTGQSNDSADQAIPVEKRRVPRLNLGQEQFRLKANGKIFPVADLSLEGMALRILDRTDLVHFPIAAHVDGMINLAREKFPLEASVRNLGVDRVGFEFENLSPVTRAAIEHFLDPIELGRELRPIPASERGVVWYQGPSGTQLLLWRGSDGQFFRLALGVRGSLVQWSSEEGVSTGRIQSSYEPSEVRGAIRFETQEFERDSVVDPGKLQIAKTVIGSSNLPSDLAGWCIRQLRFEV